MKRFHSRYRTLALAALLSAALTAVAAAVTLPPTNPPTEVAISAQVRTAYAAAGTTGSFLLQRTGSVLNAVTIVYHVSGEAVPFRDYVPLKGTRTIPAGRHHVLITVHPLAVAGSAGTVKGVRVMLAESDAYSLGTAVKATVKIVQ